AGAAPLYLLQPGRLTTPEQLERLGVGIASVKGVAAVKVAPLAEGESGCPALRVTSNDGSDLREPIAVVAAQQGVLLTELHMVRPTLEQVFMRVIQNEGGGSAVGVGQAGEAGAAA
ncbi:MAG TPA: hypothetical protein VFF65_04055, partial [Phycisphaerales bacterium]|nr:hypothetical protein [Phycisphaerales bacterium]